MASNVAETLIGAAVLAAAGGFLIYAANTADIGGREGGYELVAKFRKAEGIGVGGDVRIAGVKVGSVTGMGLDPKTYYAKVTLSVSTSVELPDDSLAKITSSSLLGDSFIAIDPGASADMLQAGDEIAFTQSSVSVTDLVGKFVHGDAEK